MDRVRALLPTFSTRLPSTWKLLAIIFALINFKSLPFAWHVSTKLNLPAFSEETLSTLPTAPPPLRTPPPNPRLPLPSRPLQSHKSLSSSLRPSHSFLPFSAPRMRLQSPQIQFNLLLRLRCRPPKSPRRYRRQRRRSDSERARGGRPAFIAVGTEEDGGRWGLWGTVGRRECEL